MKSKFIKLSLLLFASFSFITCSKEKSRLLRENSEEIRRLQKEITTTKEQLSETKKKVSFEQKLDSLITESKYPPEQELIEIPENSRSNYKRYCLNNVKTNYFETRNDIIKVEIPSTSKNLKIVDVINVSNLRVNAIVLLLNGNEGQETPDSPVNWLISSEIKIQEIRNSLNEKRLKKHKKLKIIVLHDDEYYKNGMDKIYNIFFRACTFFQGYDNIGCSENKCNLRNHFPQLTDAEYEKLKPKEEEGGVITGE